VAAFALPKSARLRRRAEYLATRRKETASLRGPLAASYRPRDGSRRAREFPVELRALDSPCRPR